MVTRVRNLMSSSSTAEYFHEENGYYTAAGGDRQAFAREGVAAWRRRCSGISRAGTSTRSYTSRFGLYPVRCPLAMPAPLRYPPADAVAAQGEDWGRGSSGRTLAGEAPRGRSSAAGRPPGWRGQAQAGATDKGRGARPGRYRPGGVLRPVPGVQAGAAGERFSLSTRSSPAPVPEDPAGAAGEVVSLSTRQGREPPGPGSRRTSPACFRDPGLAFGAGLMPFGPRRRLVYVIVCSPFLRVYRRSSAGLQGISGKKSVNAFKPGDDVSTGAEPGPAGVRPGGAVVFGRARYIARARGAPTVR